MFFLFSIITTICLQAQTRLNRPLHEDASAAGKYYHWDEVQLELMRQTGTSPEEARSFIKYLSATNKLYDKAEFLKQVSSGEISENNSQQYWATKTTTYSQLYNQLHNSAEYNNFITNQKTLNTPPIPYTGGASCNNLDFSTGTTAGWTGTWNSDGSQDPNNNWYGLNSTVGLNSSATFNDINAVHQLCTAGMDRNAPINRTPPNHTYSLRLGNDSASYSAAGSYNHQTISNTFVVTPQNNNLTYWYAVVFDQTQGSPHLINEQPYFKIRMFTGNTEIICAQYDVNCTSAATIGGFQNSAPYTYSPTLGYEAVYKDWTPVLIPLLNYVGQTVTITFETSDCNAARHFGYAYLAVDCAPYQLIMSTPFPCAGGTATLTAPAGAATYQWTGPGIVGASNTPAVTINSAGNYAVTMTTFGSQGAVCSFTLDTLITSQTSSPFANFTTSPNACLSAPTSFSNTSTGAPVSWNWAFGDGQTDNQNLNPVHTYTAPGTYTITLLATDAGGCSDTATQVVEVYPMPVVSFTSSLVCEGNPIVFDNTATTIAAPDNIVSLNWDFGNSQTYTGANPQHVFSPCGTYPVTLTATSNHNCSSSATNNVIVNCQPTVDFINTNNICFGPPINFTSTSSATQAGWNWNFGDGGSDLVNQNPVHTYQNPGSYNVSLIVTAPGGCADTAIHTVTIHPIPVANFSANIVCEGSSTIFNNSLCSIAPPDNIVFYNWTMGNNQTINGSDPHYTYTNCGTYPVSLVVVSNNNCTSTFTDTITVNCGPTANFSAPPVCYGSNTVFTDLSSVSSGNINSWCWDLDGNPATCELPNSPGPFQVVLPTTIAQNVTLTISSSGGCSDTIVQTVTVFPFPVADFSCPAVCAGTSSQLNNLSTISSGTIVAWAWNFNNVLVPNSTLQSPAVLFPVTGQQQVQLTATSDKGCAADTVLPVFINPNPVPLIAVDDPDGCPVHLAAFSGSVTPASVSHANSIVKWQWDMDSNGTNEFSHTYLPGKDTDAASYNYNNTQYDVPKYYGITLTVTSDSGCVGKVSTAGTFITVFPVPVAGFSVSSSDISPQFYFSNQSLGATSWFWNFGDVFVANPQQNSSSAFEPSHYYENEMPYTYLVSQWVSNKYGCKDSVVHPVEIIPIWTFYIPNAFTPNSDGHNEGFRGTGININTYNLWIFDRWGNMIFYSEDLDQYWDGKVQAKSGEIVQEDVYVWKVKFRDVFGGRHEKAGTVTVVK